MRVALRTIKAYLRVALIVAVAGAISLVLVRNRGNVVSFWFFGFTDRTKPINVVWLIGCTAGVTLACRWVAALAWRVGRELREMQRLQAVKSIDRKQRARAADLDERERRIDDKVARALRDEDQEGD